MLSAIVTAILEPAFALTKLPAFVRVTFEASAVIRPTKVPPVITAAVEPL